MCGKESEYKQLLKIHTYVVQSQHMRLTQTYEMCGQEYKTVDTLQNICVMELVKLGVYCRFD